MNKYEEMDAYFEDNEDMYRPLKKTVTEEIEDNLRKALGDNLYNDLSYEIYQRKMQDMQIRD